eukprot:CAMPEP_0198289206 /NCGR_PEP_ID=MMETSP1449-20131203/7480_1 /TAXON_ID=420275 /ORGANISM="Attheya septentrionalis, Strain CCMP2084" /LENGTH=584 /DNA_ID=CAMNT_0043987503 /DNA_START=369 /DNA_END=2123 /DNA_ORIENTATION=+
MSHSFHHRAPQGSTRKFPLNDKNQRAHHSEHGHGTDSLSCRNRQLQQTRVNLKKKQPSSSASWRNFFTVRLKIPAVEADIKKDSRHHRKKPVSTKSVAAATEKTPAEQKTKHRAPPDARVFVASTKRETWHGETVRDGERTSTSTRPKSGASTIQEIHSYSSLHDKLSRLQDTRMSNGAPSVASTSENSSLTGYYSLTQSGHTHKSSYSIKSLPSVAENSLGSSSNMDFGDSVHDDEQSIWDDIETIVSCVSDREDYTGSDASDGSTSDKKEKGEGNYEAKLSDDDESDHDEINPAEMLAILTANIHFGGTTPMLSNEETAAVRKLTAQRRDSRKSRNSRRVNRRLSLPKVEALIEEEPQQETPMINKTQSVDAESMGSSSLYPTIDASEDELSDFDAVLEGFMGVDELTSYEKPQDLEGDTGTLQVTKKTKKKRSTKDKKEMTEEEKTARLQRRKERSQRKLKDGDTKEAKEKRSSSRKEGDGKKKKKKHRRHRSREARRESFRSAMSKIKESNGTKVDTETLRTLGTAFRGLANEIEVGTLSKDSVEGVAVTGFLEVLKSLTEEVQDDCTLLSESSTSARGA